MTVRCVSPPFHLRRPRAPTDREPVVPPPVGGFTPPSPLPLAGRVGGVLADVRLCDMRQSVAPFPPSSAGQRAGEAAGRGAEHEVPAAGLWGVPGGPGAGLRAAHPHRQLLLAHRQRELRQAWKRREGGGEGDEHVIPPNPQTMATGALFQSPKDWRGGGRGNWREGDGDPHAVCSFSFPVRGALCFSLSHLRTPRSVFL